EKRIFHYIPKVSYPVISLLSEPPNKITLHRYIKIHNSVSVLLNINVFPNSQLF
ncbi:hypothetical protein L9F63_014163, partial [Diploptera punctata]